MTKGRSSIGNFDFPLGRVALARIAPQENCHYESFFEATSNEVIYPIQQPDLGNRWVSQFFANFFVIILLKVFATLFMNLGSKGSEVSPNKDNRISSEEHCCCNPELNYSFYYPWQIHVQ